MHVKSSRFLTPIRPSYATAHNDPFHHKTVPTHAVVYSFLKREKLSKRMCVLNLPPLVAPRYEERVADQSTTRNAFRRYFKGQAK